MDRDARRDVATALWFFVVLSAPLIAVSAFSRLQLLPAWR